MGLENDWQTLERFDGKKMQLLHLCRLIHLSKIHVQVVNLHNENLIWIEYVVLTQVWDSVAEWKKIP